jgi:hypothetical protein
MYFSFPNLLAIAAVRLITTKPICMKFRLLLFFLPAFFQVVAQNVVPNPGFEDTLGCPDDFVFGVQKAAGWNRCGVGTPDFYHTCGSPSLMGVPYNFHGYQQPRNGKGYAGFINYNSYSIQGNELLTAKLVNPLTAGLTYYIKFFVSRGDNDSVASNKMGLRFSMNACDYNNIPAFNNVAHLYTNAIITDRVGWNQISGAFVPDSAYKYITIGNFFTQAQTTIQPSNWQGFVSYYYIDDICVSPDPNKCHVLVGIEETEAARSIDVYPNPTSGVVYVRNNNYENIKDITLKNIQGQAIRAVTGIHKAEYSLDLLSVDKGIYVLEVNMGSGIVSKRLVID